MVGVTDLVERINQGVLAVWLESNAQINGGAGRGMTSAFPFFRDRLP
jgi:hypothetical protein